MYAGIQVKYARIGDPNQHCGKDSVSTYNYLIPDMFLKRDSLDLLNKPSLKTYPLPLILKNGYFMKKKIQQGTVIFWGYSLSS